MKANNYLVFKRVIDVVMSFFLILVLSWAIVIITVLNCISTRFKPFFFDKRIGLNGKEIKVLKFKSMKHDAETHPERYFTKEQMKQWNKERKVDDDPRVTRFGKILRKTSLDELPQLLNIFVGTLSFIGPRPITESELEKNYTKEEQEKLLSIRPGLTGNWAVNGRNNCVYKNHKRQELELEYIDKVSFKTDILIFFRTFIAVFDFKNVK